MKILTLCGSLRAGSLNAALLRAAILYLPETVVTERADLDLPLYNEDLPADARTAVRRLNEQVSGANAVLIVTPEYNFGIPGPLKNALDWASRPAFKSPFARKPVGLLGASPGAVGTARAQGQLKQVLLGMAAQVFPHGEFLVGQASSKFNEAGQLTDESTHEHLERYLSQFLAWVKVVESFA